MTKLSLIRTSKFKSSKLLWRISSTQNRKSKIKTSSSMVWSKGPFLLKSRKMGKEFFLSKRLNLISRSCHTLHRKEELASNIVPLQCIWANKGSLKIRLWVLIRLWLRKKIRKTIKILKMSQEFKTQNQITDWKKETTSRLMKLQLTVQAWGI